jgi:nitrous-oxide reductase
MLAIAAGIGASLIVDSPTALAQDSGKKRRRSATETAQLEMTPALTDQLKQIAAERGLKAEDLTAALKTYLPSGKHDDYIIFSSGGHSGQVFMIGVPSMRLLRSIAVFTPEPWQGFGYGFGEEILKEGSYEGRELLWGDTHHPALSETSAEYDGQFLFIGDKANARVAVIDLHDMETKQIVKNPLTVSDHGGAFVTPNTEYVIEGAQYATPLGTAYAPEVAYKENYRGMVTLWKFDRAKGRIDATKSFALELPPYFQDLFDAGKKVSDGLIFGNSFCVETVTPGFEVGNATNFEAGCSQRDMDYLHIIDWKKAEQVFLKGGAKQVNNFSVIPMETSIAEGILHLAPEPKSPHGVDVSPNGEYMIVSGKLDPHVTVYSNTKIRDAIANKKYSGSDAYGIPVLDFDAVMEKQVELGLGPLHTQFDDKGYAYTSLFLDSAVARWTLGGEYADKHPEEAWKLVTKTPVQYNIGHLVCAEGDSASPDGRYLVAMNKWSLDRFFPTGPLLPQNFQLVDIGATGTDMPVLYDMPIGVGEPHYAQMIKADKLQPWTVYPAVGWNPHTQSPDPAAVKVGEERVTRTGTTTEIFMTAVRSHFAPQSIQVQEGDEVVWHITSQEQSMDATHGFCIGGYNINLSLEPGESATIRFKADRSGVFPFYCTEFCSALHLEMLGYFEVVPTTKVADTATR